MTTGMNLGRCETSNVVIRSICNLSLSCANTSSAFPILAKPFQKAKNKAYIFCLLTALIPLLFGAVVGSYSATGLFLQLWLARFWGRIRFSGLPVVSRLGFTRLESIAATVGVDGSGPTQYLWIYLRSVAQPFSQVFPSLPRSAST